jgi:two-component system, sensor histidine kinase LadS
LQPIVTTSEARENEYMTYSRSKVLFAGGGVLAHAAPFFNFVAPLREARESSELEKLRATNATLQNEVAILKRREAEALRRADRDPLTGLYNRRRTLEMLNLAIADAARRNQYVGVLFIDLNGFKAINDDHGHAAGDRILITAAQRIAARVRTGDIVCRYGGDEFVVVLPSILEAGAVSSVADTIRERVVLPNWINGRERHVTAAIGEALYPHDGDDGATLLERADEAMYAAKTRMTRRFSACSAVISQPSRRRNDPSKSGCGAL